MREVVAILAVVAFTGLGLHFGLASNDERSEVVLEAPTANDERTAVSSDDMPAKRSVNSKPVRVARNLFVRVRYPDRSYAEGIWVRWRNDSGRSEPMQLDEYGYATFFNLRATRYRAFVSADKSFHGEFEIGQADLALGESRVDATIPKPNEVKLRVTLNGEAGFPQGLEWIYAGDPRHRLSPVDAIDREQGVARVFWYPTCRGEQRVLEFVARDWVLRKPSSKVVVLGSDARQVTRHVDLVWGGSIELRVKRPASGTPELRIQRLDEATGVWITDYARRTDSVVGPNARISPLASGTYRVVSVTGGSVSDSVDVRAGEASRLTFDLSQEVEIEGCVRSAVGIIPSDIEIEVRGRQFNDETFRDRVHGNRSYPRVPVNPDGSFQVTIPGSHEVELHPIHKLLVLDTERSVAKLTRPRDDVFVRSRPGRRVLVRKHKGGRLKRILAFREPFTAHDPGINIDSRYLRNGDLAIQNFPPGTWTVWIDSAGFLPLVLRNVVISKEGRDLGVITFERGVPFRMRCLLPDGQQSPPKFVVLTSTTHPRFTRRGDYNDGWLTFRGLTPGRYLIQIKDGYYGRVSTIADAVFDPEHPIGPLLDLRPPHSDK